ncbi:membrane protein [Kiloniella litopenaei]|uniref:17 kDa surface antigen n=1 Tax=Kiloniella litopenaei TaxID=1549748 RepID=A0A0M2R986_9PROT|nr:RT0821/Lpp0805 family surface protein [Kiloniella litopenaei]KKJ78397.1 membrane protein [Kiloniella litopenaei]
MKVKASIAALLIALSTTACSNDRGVKQTVGGLGGAIAGGLLGAQFGKGSGQIVAAAAGAVVGGFLGSEVGRYMDEEDKRKADTAYNRAQTAPVGQTIAWNNPDSGNSGTVTPVRDGTSSEGKYCREYQQTVVIGGKTEEAYGTACRQEDGSWEIQ